MPVLRTEPWVPSFLAVVLSTWAGGLLSGFVAIVAASFGNYEWLLMPTGASALQVTTQVGAFDLIALAITYIVWQRDVALSALRTSENHYRSISETAADVIITIDRQSRIVSVNPAIRRVFGYEPDEVIGHQMTILMPEQMREAHRAGLARHLATGEKHIPWFGIQLPGKRKDGSEIPLEIAFGSYLAGREPHFTGFIRDISDRQNVQAALMRSEKLAAVGRLASSIAHEINNPLEAVTNLLYLSRSTERISEIQRYVAEAEEQLKRVSVITNQTLRFHRDPGAPTAVSCDTVVLASLALLQGRLRNTDCVVKQRFRATRRARCREGEILQVLNNVIANAIDALPMRDGCLLARSRNATDWKSGRKGIIITIADNGKGMNRETMSRAFESFFTTKGVEGTGLGLWVSAELVERNRGHIRVRSSQIPGASGTVFSFFLPSAEQD